jgi:hypothetical protein
MNKGNSERQNAGLGYSPMHTKILLHAGISWFSKELKGFDPFQASRSKVPTPENIGFYVDMLLGTHIKDYGAKETAALVASALSIDAYPPRIHSTYIFSTRTSRPRLRRQGFRRVIHSKNCTRHKLKYVQLKLACLDYLR